MNRHGNIHVRDFLIPIHKHRHIHMDVCTDSHTKSSSPGSVLSQLCMMTSPDDVHSDHAVCYFVAVLSSLQPALVGCKVYKE